MSLTTRSLAALSAALLTCSAIGLSAASAADYPDKPINLIVNSGPGGGVDIIARTYQPYLEKCLGASIVVVNKPGAGGALAFAALKESAPDGYTIGYVNMPNTIAQAIEKGAPPPWEVYDYLANTTASRVGLHVSTKSEFKTYQQFLDYAKANPKILTIALGGLGNDDHLTQLQAAKAAGIEVTLVPIGDGAAARTAALGGHVAAFSAAGYETLPYKDDIHTLWYASEERDPAFPDVPTLKELGYDIVGGSNQVVGAPKGLPEAALTKLRGCYETVFKDPAFLEDGKKRGLPLHYMNAADTETFAHDQWTKLQDLWKTSPWVK